MASLDKKIDFAVIFSVERANPNGDPLNGNRPRTDYNNFGEVSDVCIKRKIRDRLQEAKENIFVQSDEKKIDGLPSLRARAEDEKHGLGPNIFKVAKGDFGAQENIIKKACERWFDVRAFGQIFAYKGSGKKTKKQKGDDAHDGGTGETDSGDGISIPIRGAVSIQSAISVEPVSITSTQITKSTSGEGDGVKKSSDTMGMKHRVDKGIYFFFGSMNPQLAEKTGFSNEDAEVLKGVLPKLFENDASSARPEGSIRVNHVFWWKHNSKAGQFSSGRVHESLKVLADGKYELSDLEGLRPEIIPGF